MASLPVSSYQRIFEALIPGNQPPLLLVVWGLILVLGFSPLTALRGRNLLDMERGNEGLHFAVYKREVGSLCVACHGVLERPARHRDDQFCSGNGTGPDGKNSRGAAINFEMAEGFGVFGIRQHRLRIPI